MLEVYHITTIGKGEQKVQHITGLNLPETLEEAVKMLGSDYVETKVGYIQAYTDGTFPRLSANESYGAVKTIDGKRYAPLTVKIAPVIASIIRDMKLARNAKVTSSQGLDLDAITAEIVKSGDIYWMGRIVLAASDRKQLRAACEAYVASRKPTADVDDDSSVE